MFFSSKGILGINARNLLYIRPYNSKKAIKFADDKIKTKQFLSARDIPVPKLYGIIKSNEELEKFDFNTLPENFALKPNKGFGGEGIIPIIEQKDGFYITAGERKISKEELKDQIRDILDGRFSISNVADYAFFEQLIVADERIGKFSYEGLPDIRIVVHNLIPVMAMLRLPTKESAGKANLHMGAVGVGIDLGKGECTNIAYKNKIIEELPNGLGKIRGLKIPYWNDILLIASKVQLITNLGYMAADICIDKNSGPVLLEINARAGLGVQIANLAPLRKRLERIQGVKVSSPIKGVRIAKDMFGNVVEKEIEQLSGKQIVSTEETVEIIEKKGNLRILAKIDTTKNVSIIDEEIAEKAGLLEDTENYEDEKSTLKLKFVLKNKRIRTVVDVEKIANKKYKMILGKRDLKDFLIEIGSETDKKKAKPLLQKIKQKVISGERTLNYHQIDQKLLQIDSKIKLLYHLRPTNLDSEREKFFANPNNNPQFEYPQLKFDPIEIVDELHKIKLDDSLLGTIFKKKKAEISNKIRLLEQLGEEDFTETSIKLFGKPSVDDVKYCKELIENCDLSQSKNDKLIYNAEEVKEKFEQVFEKYELKHWAVKIKDSMVSDCVAGKNSRLFLKSKARFSQERIESLIVHEIETHILTAENGKMQPYEIFNRGFANYLKTQEGLAVWNVEKQSHIPFTKNVKALNHVITIYNCLEKSFVDAYREALKLGITKEDAFRSCLKAKRGFYDTKEIGAFTKDYIYFKGYFQIKQFVENGGQIKDLYIGKMDLGDLETVKKVPGVVEAKILPVWLK